MNVCFGSIVRDGSHYAKRYMEQCAALKTALLPSHLRVIVCEGDSRDNTRDTLASHAKRLGVDLLLLRKDTGGPKWPSCVDVRRFRQKASVDNEVMNAIPVDADYFIFCESDLVWTPDVMLKLIAHLQADNEHNIAAVSPMTFANNGAHYDIWGLTGFDDCHWGPFHPYHRESFKENSLVQVKTTGSCICMRGDLARVVRFSPDEEFHGLSANIYAQNQGGIYVDTSLRIVHG